MYPVQRMDEYGAIWNLAAITNDGKGSAWQLADGEEDHEVVAGSIASTLASLQPVDGMNAGAIVRVDGFDLPVLLVTYAPDLQMWWSFPVATSDQPVLVDDFILPIGIVPYRVHMAFPLYVGTDSPVEILAQLSPAVIGEVKSAALDFLIGPDGDTLLVTPAAVAYRGWLSSELAAYRHRSICG